MSLNYASASSLNNSVDRLSDLVSYTVPPVGPRTAKTLTVAGVTSASTGYGAAPIAGNALYFGGFGQIIQIDNATGSWGASSRDATDGGANGKLGFSLNGQYTIECFIRFTQLNQYNAWYEAGSNGVSVAWTNAFFYNGVSQVSFGAQFNANVSANTWYHVAMTRFYDGSDNIIQCWFDGTQIGTGVPLNQNFSGPSTFGSFTAPYIGGGNGSGGFGLDAYIQEYRISNIRRYTANFTPTSTAFVNDSNTVLLIHGSNPAVDDNS